MGPPPCHPGGKLKLCGVSGRVAGSGWGEGAPQGRGAGGPSLRYFMGASKLLRLDLTAVDLAGEVEGIGELRSKIMNPQQVSGIPFIVAARAPKPHSRIPFQNTPIPPEPLRLPGFTTNPRDAGGWRNTHAKVVPLLIYQRTLSVYITCLLRLLQQSR